VLILIGTSAAKQLPTIRSRCQLVRFRPLPAELVARLLVERELVDDPREAQRLARYSDGSLKRALDLADPALWTFRAQLLDCLGRPGLESVRFAKVLLAFVEEAGKEAARRRARLKQIVEFAVDFYRHLVRASSGTPGPDDPELDTAVRAALASPAGNGEVASQGLERCLDCIDQLARNVHITTLVECWLDDLARIYAGQ
jgi:DNA polymerase-3 subunit delta'